MKLNENTRFSHPVLCEDTSDYTSGNFKVEIKVTEDTVKNSLILECITVLNEPYLSNLIKDKLAQVFIIISCRGTYFYKQIELINSAEELTFKPGELTGPVELRGIIASSITIHDFKAESLNEEYGEEGFTIGQSELLAFDIRQKIHIGRKKIPPMESIFELAFDEDLIEGEIDVSLEKDKIRILANKTTCEKIHHLRNSGDTSSIVFSSVYLPAIMQILSYLQSDGEEYSDNPWYEPFIAKCDYYNIDIANDNILLSAQKLLKNPLNLVMENYNG
jgi:hypothetical protein